MKVGRVIGGRYRLLRQVGEGAMAAIWEAEHQTLGRMVAVKFLHAVGPPQSEASQRFVREARVAAAIKHRNVVDIIDFGLSEDDHRPYMVMELLEGQTLSAYLESRGRLGIADAARIVTDVLRGLAAVHDAGIVHRDLKPDNIFLVNDEDGPFPKLLDFGLSRRVGRGDMTAEGIILGTPDYMSPEQAKGQRHIDQRTDIYSMGVILYELVSGHMPFDGGTLTELLSRVLEGRYVPLDSRLPDVPPLLIDIVARAMHKDRNERFANAREMRAALATANLAPFAQNESGLIPVDPMRASGAGAFNPPSGVFSESQRGSKATMDAPLDTLEDPVSEEGDVVSSPPPLAGEATRMDDLSEEPTRAVPSPVRAAPRPPPPPPPRPSAPAVQHTPAAYAHTMPSGAAVVLPEMRRDPSTSRRVDDSAGVFKTTQEDEPKGSSAGWWALVLVIALASVAGGVLVYWAQTGSIPFVGSVGDVAVVPDVADAPLDGGPLDAGTVDAGAEIAIDAGIDAGASAITDGGLDGSVLDGSVLDGSDASFADAAVDDAGGPDGSTIAAEPEEEEPRGRRRPRRRRPARRR